MPLQRAGKDDDFRIVLAGFFAWIEELGIDVVEKNGTSVFRDRSLRDRSFPKIVGDDYMVGELAGPAFE